MFKLKHEKKFVRPEIVVVSHARGIAVNDEMVAVEDFIDVGNVLQMSYFGNTERSLIGP